jgi:transcription elongation GreA/GreB family factor
VTTLSIAFGECFIDLSFIPRASDSVKLPSVDKSIQLLREAADLIEHATYHDGRYGQRESNHWQNEAQRLVPRMAEALGREPYEQFKD